MCGLVAYHAYHPAAAPVERRAVAAVAGAMRRRGPDGEGAWFAPDGRVALAHTRLAVIGPGAAGAQPMAAPGASCVVSFNGAIYNHRELRLALERRGHRFRGDSDTEVLLAMYREHGEDMLARLRGMFAFALWDAARAELVLARDAYGIKPLYYADDGWTFRAASQVKALARDPALDGERCAAGWAGFWLLGSVPEPFTTRRAIRALPAGTMMRVGAAGPSLPRRWFELPRLLRDGARAARDAAAGPVGARLRAAIADSVRAHLVADVPVGVFLSAGVDSGVVLSLAREAGARPQALTVVFEDLAGGAGDESGPAADTAAACGVHHRVRRVSGAELDAQLPRVLAAMDQPSIDGVNTWFASRAAAECGLKVVLSGLGGDELLGGYPSFRQLPWLAPATRWPARLPLLGRLSRAAATPLLARARLHPKLAGVLALGGGWAGAYLLRRGLFMPWELAAVMGEEGAREGLARLAPTGLLEALLAPDPGTARGRVIALESGAYLRNQLLRDADWAGMAHGVEIRTPLVDRVLAETLAPLLCTRPLRAGKAMLAAVPARRLPASVTARRKSGFEVPLEAWLARRPSNAPRAAPAHVEAVRRFARLVAEAA